MSPTGEGCGGMEFDLIRRLGVTVIEVHQLERTVCYVKDVRVALVREGLPTECQERAAAWLLSEVTRPETSTVP